MLATILLFIIILLIFWIVRLKRDITDREGIEKNLKFREEHFTMLFDIAPIFIDAFDGNGRCYLWNKECERVFGWTIEELNAHENTSALFFPDPKDQAIFLDAFSSKKESHYQEMSPMSKSGELIPCRWINVNLLDDATIFIGIDMRAQKKAEKELLNVHHELQELNHSLQDRVAASILEIHKKEQLLLQQSRLAQMGEMISMIAHQWRQPLSVIDMTAFDIQNKIDLKKFDLNDQASQKTFLKFLEESLSDIDRYTQYLTGTIEDFTNFFKPNKEKEVTTLNIPIEKALNILDTTTRRESVDVEIDINTTSSLHIYTYEVMQVVLNIVKNSIDNFVEKKVTNRQIRISADEHENQFSIKICDNGGGIEESVLEKIFDPYFSTKTEKNGTGLGLYISKIVIENHSSGMLNVSNTRDGVCFEIILYGDK
ncbi:MAG: PAS domain-containing sensor histidine kinase [Sulfurospirillaceae bacterium]|nr:PAS domain-containing sensor histidine kinase [Sulfurospirillaceae bacterium]